MGPIGLCHCVFYNSASGSRPVFAIELSAFTTGMSLTEKECFILVEILVTCHSTAVIRNSHMVPFELLAVDHGNAVAAKGVIDRAVVVRWLWVVSPGRSS